MRGRMVSVVAVAAALSLVAACGGGTRDDEAATLDGEGQADGGGNGQDGSGDAACEGATLEATEVGITADTITVTVMADTGAQAVPGMANGSVEAVEAWAELVNEQGGLACRQVEVRTYDSKINPDESRNGYVEGCESSFAMVGTFAIAVADASPLAECRDQAGEPTGLPEVAATAQSVLHYCNPTTYGASGQGQPCPPVEGVREIQVATALGEYMTSELGDDAHGIYLVANTTPATVAGIMPVIRHMQDVGLRADAEAGASGRDPQSHFTPYATTLADEQSTFVFNSASFPTFLTFRREAVAQGDDSVEMWMCQSTCYDPAYIEAAGDLAEGTQILLSHLPFEEAGANEEMQTFVDRVETHNGFSILSWTAARLFEEAVRRVVEADGPNALTRQSLLDAMEAIEDFDADGLIGPVTPSEKLPSRCIVVVEVTGGGFERVYPEAEGELACGDHATIEIDPATAFRG
jgi:ABC-type branched-subunit amino acid transport system substrate-binding protein